MAKWTYNWEHVERHLREALGSLKRLHECMVKHGRAGYRKGVLTDGMIGAEFEHVYHHLNFAWNTRVMDEDDAESDFELHEKWPLEFDRFERDSKRHGNVRRRTEK